LASLICGVPIEHLGLLWPQVEPHIAHALDRDAFGRFLPHDVLSSLAKGDAKLWISWNDEERAAEAAMVTEILQFPRCRECHVTIIGGRNKQAWLEPFFETLETYARAQGCTQMSGMGRKGWERVMARLPGYRPFGFGIIKQF
jgi:hypothetical protein